MQLKEHEIPVNDEGTQANIVVAVDNVLYPFWVVTGQYANLVPGERYLVICAVKGETPETPDQLYFLQSGKDLDTVLWETIETLLRSDFPRVDVIDILENDTEHTLMKFPLAIDAKPINIVHSVDGDISRASPQSIH